ncbi:unnamed protein product [Pseudo-nitzschia multistriata]|uniref:Glycosyl hydrolase family 38 C-terminal domain-containing protein n=1 Tax=Pseudo-nitzschia multistriata TaxID=183589 RepID=A0A448ZFE0_9STRA|nr:unnamed protein product [Pseudo-nitzschia multistriata]
MFPMAALLTICLLLSLLADNTDGAGPEMDDMNLGLGRRLRFRNPSTSRLWRITEPMKNDFDENAPELVGGLRYLTLGGPSTFGRGLGEKRTSEAYPYLLSSEGTIGQERVRNVAQSQYETGDLAFASLCTQSLVEGESARERAKEGSSLESEIDSHLDSSSWSSSSVAYDVITLEYTKDGTSDVASAAYTSSMNLLTRRLRKRYPLSTIVVVQLWSPLDLVYYDPVANRNVSFAEWRNRKEQNNQQYQDKNRLKMKKQKKLSVEAMKEHVWTFRDLSPAEQQRSNDLENMVVIEEGEIYRMSRPRNINDSLDIIMDWFLEEEIKAEDEDNTSLSLHYTLSRRGHSVVAAGLRDVLALSAVPRTRQNDSGAFQVQSAPRQYLGSWGSGDSCQLWYRTGKDRIPDSLEYSIGLKSEEFYPKQYALEVVSSKGGTLTVYNHFDEDRIVYLTYLTTSARAAANKVYPKTKVSMVKEPMQTGHTTIVLDPAHDDNSDVMHRTRTSAVGLVKARSKGILEFTPLEEYTVHHFRIVGISFLTKEKTPHDVPFEFAISPRKLLISKSDDAIANEDMEGEE